MAGDSYRLSSSVKSYEQAEHWYRAAYELAASVVALRRLAEMSLQRRYTRKAVGYLKQGVEHQDCVSAYWLAKVYWQEGLASDAVIRALLEQAMAGGQVRAKNLLAFLSMQGKYGLAQIPVGVGLYFSSLVDAVRIGTRDLNDPRLW